MKLIVGLGNIGPHFDGTRHNIGFETLDAYATHANLDWQEKPKFKAHVAEGIVAGQKIILLKPTTYYNLVGESALAAKQFYKIANADVLAVHDELALPFGVIRTRPGGSDAGNNGIKSITANVGENFARIRIGIANDLLPRMDAADFVLGHFSHQETQKLADIKKHAATLIDAFIDGAFEHTTKELM